MTKHITNSLNETLKLGKKLVNSFNTNVIGLIGDLGSGKTAFTKGVGEYFNIDNITSPTFVVMKVYPVKLSQSDSISQGASKNKKVKFKKLVHIDCYRFEDYRSLIDIGIEEYINDSESLVLIEWADKIKDSLPRKTKYFKFKLGRAENERIITSD